MANPRKFVRNCYVPTRFVIVIMLFWAALISYVFRTNMSLAIVAMVNHTALDLEGQAENQNSSDQCPYQGGVNSTDEAKEDGPFVWRVSAQSNVLGGFFYGYATTQILNGWLLGRYGSKYLMGGGMILGSILTLLTPVLAELGSGFVTAARVFTGISQSVVFPGINTLFPLWIPSSERSRLYSVVYVGANLGGLVAMPVIGWLCKFGFAGGWPSVFYTFGSCGLLWTFFWFFLVYDNPTKHPRISPIERNYILENTPKIKYRKVPWFSILTSRPVWVYVFFSSTGLWLVYTRMMELPSYLNSVLHFPIQQNAYINTLVSSAAIVCGFISGFIADFLLNREILNTTHTRKLMEILGQLGCAGCLMAVTFSGCNSTVVITFLTLSAGMMGFSCSGGGVLNMDIAPSFSGIVFGMANTAGAISGALAPLVTGLIVKGSDVFVEWHVVFYVSAALGVLGSSVFLFFGTAEAQKWNFNREEDDEEDLVLENECIR